MAKLLESVPNFSEGRDKDKINKIVNAVKLVELVKVLDVHSDVDHNRTVVTFVGEPSAVCEAAFNLTAKAVELIDINKHEGVHPFIGAVDVVPFIPMLDGKTSTSSVESMLDASETARKLGERVVAELALPVYFYGEKRSLPFIRKHFPSLVPDLGGPNPHPTAGAVAIGARNFLIAFNVNLDSNDLEAAKEIAKSIRETHGGLPGVRAIGVSLESRGIVQVSVNITDHEEVTSAMVLEQVRARARMLDIEILETETVGLTPEQVLGFFS